jgi:hypothetical protein
MKDIIVTRNVEFKASLIANLTTGSKNLCGVGKST